MLNSFLQERFAMAELVHNANLEIEKARETGEKRLEGLRRYKSDKLAFQGFLKNISSIINGYNEELRGHLGQIINIIGEYERYDNTEIREPVRLLGDLVI